MLMPSVVFSNRHSSLAECDGIGLVDNSMAMAKIKQRLFASIAPSDFIVVECGKVMAFNLYCCDYNEGRI